MTPLDLQAHRQEARIMPETPSVEGAPTPPPVVQPHGGPPHPALTAYYAGPAERAGFVRQLFDATARDYDGINWAFSLGTGRSYRAQALRRVGLTPGAQVLDVATGTGMVAAAAQKMVGPSGSVVALDVSAGMLRVAGRHAGLRLIQASVEALPLADARFDLLTMGYALRHVGSLELAFSEFARVLRPGGQVLLLEIGRPGSRLALRLARAYLGHLVPLLSRLAGSGRQAETLMRYYWDTIESCVPPQTILAALQASGFRNATCVSEFGVFKTYTATRP
jgi:demethylmenaquinone methyltransferase/2-methoxy-6-polyprenyl-1,4-benzoquinol methylase